MTWTTWFFSPRPKNWCLTKSTICFLYSWRKIETAENCVRVCESSHKILWYIPAMGHIQIKMSCFFFKFVFLFCLERICDTELVKRPPLTFIGRNVKDTLSVGNPSYVGSEMKQLNSFSSFECQRWINTYSLLVKIRANYLTVTAISGYTAHQGENNPTNIVSATAESMTERNSCRPPPFRQSLTLG